MSNFKPYWTRHPLQLRLFSLVMLLTSPMTLPIFLLWSYREEIYSELAMNYRYILRVLTGEWKP